MSVSMPETAVSAPSVRPRSWLRRIIGGGQIIETCPKWCTGKHDHHQSSHLVDLDHESKTVALELSAQVAAQLGESRFESWPILAAKVVVDPYSDNPACNRPYVAFALSPDDDLYLSLEEFAAMIADIRAHCDKLDKVHAQGVAAHAEYGVGR